MEVLVAGATISRTPLFPTLLGDPPASARTDLAVDIEALGGAERWTRHFGTHAMRLTLRQDGVLLCERLGPAHFHFELVVRDGALLWIVRRVAVLGIPLPVRWFAGVAAREFAEDDMYRFDVAAALPLAGLLVRYRGTLAVP